MLTHLPVVTDGHLRCDASHVDGCQRCRPPLMAVCCDRCNPEAFNHYHVPFVKEPAKRRFVIPASFIRGPPQYQLRDALYKWRYEKAVELFGKGYVYQLGADLLMDDDVLWRVIDCWSFGKISGTDDLKKQTDWAHESIDDSGQSLISFIQDCVPTNVALAPTSRPPLMPVPVTNTPANNLNPAILPIMSTGPSEPSQNPTATQPRKRAPIRCGKCGLVAGHNIRRCPKRDTDSFSDNKENVAVKPALPPATQFTPTVSAISNPLLPLLPPMHVSALASVSTSLPVSSLPQTLPVQTSPNILPSCYDSLRQYQTRPVSANLHIASFPQYGLYGPSQAYSWTASPSTFNAQHG